MFDRIWKKFTVALLIVAFIPVLYFGYHDLEAARHSVAESALREIFLNSKTRSKDIESVFTGAHMDINYLRSSIAIEFMLSVYGEAGVTKAYWQSLVEKEFLRFLSLKRGYSRVGLIDDYGNEVVIVTRNGEAVASLESGDKKNRLTAPFYVETAKLDGYGIVAMPMRNYVHPELNLKRVSLVRYATKIFDKSGRPRGIIYADLNGSEIFKGLAAESFERRRKAALLTHGGSYIYNPFAKTESIARHGSVSENIRGELPENVVDQILSGRSGVITDDDDYLFAYSAVYPQMENPNRFYVTLDKYPRELLAPQLLGIKMQYAKGAAIALALVILVSIAISRALTRKIKTLRDGVERFSNHELDHRINIRSGDEIERLAKAYNAMADSLREYSESLERKVEERSIRIKQVERKLMETEKLAAIGFLSAGVAHEINNPISIIVTRLELLEKAFKKGETKNVAKDLEVLKNHSIRIGKIAGDLLAFSRKSKKELLSVDINETVERVVGLIEYPMEKKSVSLQLALLPNLSLAWANQSGMEQVVYNLVYNAYQATESGGTVTISTWLEEKELVVLECRDTGSGIKKGDIERIFEPFFTTKETGEGTGLGLSISYGLVKDCGGTIDVKSEPGKGTIFTIRLDVAKTKVKGEKKEFVNSNG